MHLVGWRIVVDSRPVFYRLQQRLSLRGSVLYRHWCSSCRRRTIARSLDLSIAMVGGLLSIPDRFSTYSSNGKHSGGVFYTVAEVAVVVEERLPGLYFCPSRWLERAFRFQTGRLSTSVTTLSHSHWSISRKARPLPAKNCAPSPWTYWSIGLASPATSKDARNQKLFIWNASFVKNKENNWHCNSATYSLCRPNQELTT